MVPTGFFGHLMIRLLHTQLIALQPLLYWRYGFILTGTNARTSALVELVHSTSCIHVTVRSHTQLAAAHVLRLINETLRVLLTDWYYFHAFAITSSFSVGIKWKEPKWYHAHTVLPEV